MRKEGKNICYRNEYGYDETVVASRIRKAKALLMMSPVLILVAVPFIMVFIEFPLVLVTVAVMAGLIWLFTEGLKRV